jgi:hypothetical protein
MPSAFGLLAGSGEKKVTRVGLIVRSAVLKSAMLPKPKPDISTTEMAALYEWHWQWPRPFGRRRQRA